MTSEKLIKRASGAKGGSGGEYAILRLPKRFINEPILMRIATKNEINKYGIITKHHSTHEASETTKRINARKEKLDIHLSRLKKHRDFRNKKEREEQ